MDGLLEPKWTDSNILPDELTALIHEEEESEEEDYIPPNFDLDFTDDSDFE